MRAIRHFTSSSSFFVGLVFSSMVLVGILFVIYFLVLANDDIFLRESEAAIKSKLQHLTHIEHIAGIDGVSAELEQLKRIESGYFFALRSATGRIVSSNLPAWPEPADETLENDMGLFEVPHHQMTHSSQSRRLLSEHYDVMAIIHRFDNGYQLLIGRNIDDLEIAQWVGSTFGWLMIVLLLSISLISFAVAYYVVTRINRIADTADRIIDTGNLSERLPVDSSWDDLSKLSISLNRMFTKLEQQVHAIRTVSDNIAHDLRTPLTRIRSKLENLAPEEVKHSLIHDVDTLLSMFSGLLRIAEVEYTKQRSGFSVCNIQTIAEDVADLYAPLFEDKQQRFSMHLSAVTAWCDKDLIFQALANVLDNAVKFTPENGEIELTLSHHAGQCIVRVVDSGPGIAAKDIDKVTQRFFRAEASRTTPGFGLGMALVQAIMKIHHGQIVYCDRPGGGLICELRFTCLMRKNLSR